MDIPPFEDLVKQIKIYLWLIGIPFNDKKIYLRFYFLITTIVITIIEEGAFFVAKYSPQNFLELTQLIPCLFVGILSTLKILAVVAKREKIFKLTKSLEEIYSKTIENQTSRDLIKRKIIIMKMLLRYYFILNVVLVSVYNFTLPIIMFYTYFKTNTVNFKLPYAVVVPFSTKMWHTWFFVFFHTISSGYICVFFFTTVDAIYYVLTLHTCNNFAIISNEIKHLDATNTHMIIELVKKHQTILRFSEDLEEIFRIPNLLNVLIGSLEICALGFNLTMGKWAQVPGCVLFFLSVILQILLMSVFGENIIRESRKVGDAVFLCKWYDMDAKSKKILLIIMTRAHKHQKLTAYKFSTISYESFTKIISTSWSYFTILRTVYKPSDSVSTE